jgi:SAM-dependent methyltransferase
MSKQCDESFFPATAMPDKDWWEALWPDPEKVLLKLGIRAGMTVVDLCCGDGLFTAPMRRLVQPGRVIGIDIDPVMLQRAQAVCGGMANCTLQQGDARQLGELLAKPVDYVLIANTFHGVPDKAELAHGVFSVLNPGGHFAVVNWHSLPREQTTVLGKPRGPATAMRMSPPMVQAIVEPAGFHLERVVNLPPYHYGAIFAAEAAPGCRQRSSLQGVDSISSCSSRSWLGGIAAGDFAALDRLAVKLIGLDSGFAAPLREIGRIIGERIAVERDEKPVGLEVALSALISACGLEGVVESRVLQRDDEGALLQITGCAAVLGGRVRTVDRAVCGFDAGLFEGFLRGVTGEGALSAEETACLGLGHASCEFTIQRWQAPGEREGVAHGRR